MTRVENNPSKTTEQTNLEGPVRVVKVEGLDRLLALLSRPRPRVRDDRRLAAHLDDALRLARHLAVVERPHADRHLHRRHLSESG